MTENSVPFEFATNLKYVRGTTMTKPAGGGAVSQVLPQTGYLSSVYISVSATISGTLSNQNALGLASIIRRIRLYANAGQMIFDISGASYFYLLARALNLSLDPLSYNEGMLAVTTGTKTLNIILPVSFNTRDNVGLLMLQNKQTQVTLEIEFESDTTVATGATVTATAQVGFKIFEVPANPASQPPLDMITQTLEDVINAPSATQMDYQVPIGSILTGLYGLCPAGWTTFDFIAQNSNFVESYTPELHRLRFNDAFNTDLNLAGTALTGINKRVFMDRSSTDGLGQFMTRRDPINTRQFTDLKARLVTAGSGNIYWLRRTLVPLAPN